MQQTSVRLTEGTPTWSPEHTHSRHQLGFLAMEAAPQREGRSNQDFTLDARLPSALAEQRPAGHRKLPSVTQLLQPSSLLPCHLATALGHHENSRSL